ncbi:hypothetical protein [Bdellovibrio reynosensis]|uniref:Ankyrin repeat domain-containing protein n=1 Tax=Bdellovibrio reynosensis TaxID=2835041 RepID=A0ABY4C932_9BACT|nr:hypothetical protein [Bdellovibrio reynosensis]UOF01437.1 hypothetical protein MNR06_00530 [Bdellovibrio reynosensis]
MYKIILPFFLILFVSSCSFKKATNEAVKVKTDSLNEHTPFKLNQEQKTIVDLVKFGNAKQLASFLDKNPHNLNFNLDKKNSLLSIALNRSDKEVLTILFERGLSLYSSSEHEKWLHFSNKVLLNRSYRKKEKITELRDMSFELEDEVTKNTFLALYLKDIETVSNLIATFNESGLREFQRKKAIECDQMLMLSLQAIQSREINSDDEYIFLDKYLTSVSCKKSFKFNVGQNLFEFSLFRIFYKLTTSYNSLFLVEKYFFRTSDYVLFKDDTVTLMVSPGLLLPKEDLPLSLNFDQYSLNNLPREQIYKIEGKKLPDVRTLESGLTSDETVKNCVIDWLSGMEPGCSTVDYYFLMFRPEERAEGTDEE